MPDYSDQQRAAARQKLDAFETRLRADYANREKDPYAVGADMKELGVDEDTYLALGFEDERAAIASECKDLDANVLTEAEDVAMRFSRDVVEKYAWDRTAALVQLEELGAVDVPIGDPGDARIAVRKPDGGTAHLHFSKCTVEQLRAAIELAKAAHPPKPPPKPPEPAPAPPDLGPVTLPRSGQLFAAGFVCLVVGTFLPGSLGRLAQTVGTVLETVALWRAKSDEIAQWGAWAKAKSGRAAPLTGIAFQLLGAYRTTVMAGAVIASLVAGWNFVRNLGPEWKDRSARESRSEEKPQEAVEPTPAPPTVGLNPAARPLPAPVPSQVVAPSASAPRQVPAAVPNASMPAPSAAPPAPVTPEISPAAAPPEHAHPKPAVAKPERAQHPPASPPSEFAEPPRLQPSPEAERAPQYDDPDVDPSARKKKSAKPNAQEQRLRETGHDEDLDTMEKKRDPYEQR